MELAYEIMEVGSSHDLRVSQQAEGPEKPIMQCQSEPGGWEPGEPMVWSQSEGWQTQGLGRANVSVWFWSQGKANILVQSAVRQEDFTFIWSKVSLFCIIQVFNRLEDHPH